jgi:hypothetical protein
MVGRTQGAVPEHWNLWLSVGNAQSGSSSGNRKLTPSVSLRSRGLKGASLHGISRTRILKCIDCGADFVFTAGEQLFFHDKQFTNEPKRCKACKAKRASTSGSHGARQLSQGGDADQLLRMRQGDDRPLQTHARPACLLPGVLPAAANQRRHRLIAESHLSYPVAPLAP